MHRCSKITKDGHQCTRMCKGKDKLCWQHKKNAKKSPKRRTSPKKSPKNTERTPEEIQRKYCSCISTVKNRQPNVNAFAICSKTVGRVTNSCKQYE
jgi:hypothetical protein